MITCSEIQKLPSALFSLLSGDLSQKALHVRQPESADSQSLIFISKPEHIELVLQKKPALVIAHKNLETTLKAQASHLQFASIYLTPSISIALSQILPFFDLSPKATFSGQIHPTAVVHLSAQVASSAYIGPHCVIEAGARIGEKAILISQVYVGADATVGRQTTLHPFVMIGGRCDVGAFCIIHGNTTVGSDGFGFATLPNKMHLKIPQIGNVVIEDNVELGAHCAIDRATISSTIIRKGAKLDNFCHIAHNTEVGENSILAGGFMTAGSCVIGKNVMAGGGVHVAGHVKIADNVTLAGRTGVTTSIEEAGVYGGFPVVPQRESLKIMMTQNSLPKMRKQLKKILKHLNLNDDE